MLRARWGVIVLVVGVAMTGTALTLIVRSRRPGAPRDPDFGPGELLFGGIAVLVAGAVLLVVSWGLWFATRHERRGTDPARTTGTRPGAS